MTDTLAHPDVECDSCGAVKAYYLLSYQRDKTNVCSDCINRANVIYRAERKAQLDAMPRCQFCNRRATGRYGVRVMGAPWYPAWLCGHHGSKARRMINGIGIFGMFQGIRGADAIAMLVKSGAKLLRELDDSSYQESNI